MGTFRVDCQIEDYINPKRRAAVAGLLVDTGSEHTWIPGSVLKRLRVKPQKKDVTFVMANGKTVTRTIGFAVLRIGEAFTIDEVVFAQEGDLCPLGARTLEGMNLQVDPRQKKLVAAGPVPAAGLQSTAIEPHKRP